MEKFLTNYNYGAAAPTGATAPLAAGMTSYMIAILVIMAAVLAVSIFFTYKGKKTEATKKLQGDLEKARLALEGEKVKAKTALTQAQYAALAQIVAAEMRSAAMATAKGSKVAADKVAEVSDSVKGLEKAAANLATVKDLGFDKVEAELLVKEMVSAMSEDDE